MMKFTADRLYADPEMAARKIVEIANATDEAVQDGRIHIEKINGPFLYRERETPDEYKAGLDFAIERGWPVMHESGTFVKLQGRRVGLCAVQRLPPAGANYLVTMRPLRALHSDQGGKSTQPGGVDPRNQARRHA